jgi:hypothetical protein
MAVVAEGRVAVHAAPFFTEGHLVYRLRSILAKPRRSVSGPLASYVSAIGVLGLAGWTVMVLFPMNGEAQIVTATAGLRPAVVGLVEGRRVALDAAARRMQFNVRVPARPAATHEVVYLKNVDAPVLVGELDGFMEPPPPPPPPAPGQPVRVYEQGVRLLRPGLPASPEEIQGFIASFPERSLVEVIQGEDGTIHKVMVTRRPSDATSSMPFDASILDSPAGLHAAAGTTNWVH